jgi:hypothetical protein
MKYATYIMTAFETEIEREFKTKKDMINYLKNELFAKKYMESIAVLCFKLDAENYKETLKNNYTYDNRFIYN